MVVDFLEALAAKAVDKPGVDEPCTGE